MQPVISITVQALEKRRRESAFSFRLARATVLTLVVVALAGCTSSPKLLKPEELVWPPAPEKPRIKFLRILSDRKSIEGAGSKLLTALVGEGPNEALSKPYGVAVVHDGNVYVTETGEGRVFVFDTRNSKLSFLGSSPLGSVSLPLGIAVDSIGLVYISDGKLKCVLVYNRDGDLVESIGKPGDFQNPAGIAVDWPRRRLCIVDSHGHNVKVYTLSGKFLFAFGKRGTGDGEFNYPTNIAIGKDGRIYVVDTMNARVEVFDQDGNFLSKFGSLGDGLGQFTRPKGIALDSEGNIYVVDAAFNNFQIFNQKGELLLFVGSLGTKPGMFWLPAGIAIDDQDRIFVVDQVNKRVQVFQLIKHAE
ncbi:MAG: 6-bladed beta-propeller [Bacteroidota bacterium]